MTGITEKATKPLLSYIAFLQLIGPIFVVLGHSLNGFDVQSGWWYVCTKEWILFVSHAPVFYDFGISALVQSKKPDFGLSGLFLFSSQKKSSLVVALCCVEPGFSPAQNVFSAIADRSSAQRCLADCAVVLFSATEYFGTHLVFTCPVFALCMFAIVAVVVFPAAYRVVSGTGRRGRIVYASHQNGMFGAERFTP